MNGRVYLRSAENRINENYYPNGPGTWPIDPKTGKIVETEIKVKVPKNFNLHHCVTIPEKVNGR